MRRQRRKPLKKIRDPQGPLARAHPKRLPGGGTTHFDGKLSRENGRFVPKALQALNPERLK